MKEKKGTDRAECLWRPVDGYAFPSGVNISPALIGAADGAVKMKENIHAEERRVGSGPLLRLINDR